VSTDSVFSLARLLRLNRLSADLPLTISDDLRVIIKANRLSRAILRGRDFLLFERIGCWFSIVRSWGFDVIRSWSFSKLNRLRGRILLVGLTRTEVCNDPLQPFRAILGSTEQRSMVKLKRG
jgi:hypothetical protein